MDTVFVFGSLHRVREREISFGLALLNIFQNNVVEISFSNGNATFAANSSSGCGGTTLSDYEKNVYLTFIFSQPTHLAAIYFYDVGICSTRRVSTMPRKKIDEAIDKQTDQEICAKVTSEETEPFPDGVRSQRPPSSS